MNLDDVNTYFPAELIGPGCSVDIQFERRTDPRFEKTGFETNEYDVQIRSGVLNILESEPQYMMYQPHVLEKTKSIYYGWTRPTIQWNLSCEWHGSSRGHAYKIYKEHPINTTPAEQPNFLWSYGVFAISFAFLGPVLACVCQVASRRNNDGFACMVGMVVGSISGYFCLLILSIFAVLNMKKIGDLIQSNLDSLPLYD